MHFWIDKRSQSCGFGRARVAASLSGTGIGFGHHPRRMGGKSMLTPIHRFPAVDCRPYRPHRETHQNNHRHEHADVIQQRVRESTRSNQYRGQQGAHVQPPQVPQSPSYHITNCNPISQYGPSHSVELEGGILGVASTGPAVAQPQSIRTDPDTQFLPSHLKFGMWAALGLTTVFIAVFQGTGLEFLIFCGLCMIMVLLGCVMSICSLCGRPQILLIDDIAPAQAQAAIEVRAENPQDIVTVEVTNEPTAQPPPYHIAILLPENSKEPQPIMEESPPPSYDKLEI